MLGGFISGGKDGISMVSCSLILIPLLGFNVFKTPSSQSDWAEIEQRCAKILEHTRLFSLGDHIKCTLKSTQHYKADSVVIVSHCAWETTKIRHIQRNGLLSSDKGVRGKKM